MWIPCRTTHEISTGHCPLGRLSYVPDPDALATEFSSRNVGFFRTLKDSEDGDDGLRGFEVKDADGYILFFGRPR